MPIDSLQVSSLAIQKKRMDMKGDVSQTAAVLIKSLLLVQISVQIILDLHVALKDINVHQSVVR